MTTVTPMASISFALTGTIAVWPLLHVVGSEHGDPPFRIGKVPGEGSCVDDEEPRLRVLVVDNEENFRMSLILLIGNICDCAVVEAAESGEQAVTLVCDRDSFDLIFMDYSMFAMNGLEACRAMRAHRTSARIILMSAHYSPEVRKEADEMGVTLLSKPFDDTVLERILRECDGGDPS